MGNEASKGSNRSLATCPTPNLNLRSDPASFWIVAFAAQMVDWVLKAVSISDEKLVDRRTRAHHQLAEWGSWRLKIGRAHV